MDKELLERFKLWGLDDCMVPIVVDGNSTVFMVTGSSGEPVACIAYEPEDSNK